MGESSKGRRVLMVTLLILGIMILNYFLLYLADSISVSRDIYVEDGVVSEEYYIPRNASLNLIIGSSSNEYTEVILYGVNASCILSDLDNIVGNKTVYLNKSNQSYKLVFEGRKWFRVYNLTGNISYKYRVYRIDKPFLFLSVIALFISIVGFAVSFYILQSLILEKTAERMGRRKR